MAEVGELAAVVPVLNEADSIGDVVHGLRSAGACCVLVVDGGSTDGTAARAAAVGATVVHEPRPGYGRACLTGAGAAQAYHRHALVAFLDGDGSCDPADLPRLRARADVAQVVLGVRERGGVEGGAYPWHARAGNFVTARLISVRSGRRVRDLAPFKVLHAGALARLQLRSDGYAWTAELVARACADRGLSIAEVPIGFRARRGGRSKVSGRPLASLRAGLQMLGAAITETSPRPRVVLMAKSPMRAKSRLAAEAGAGIASGFWTASVVDTATHLMGAAANLRLEARVMLTAPDELEEARELLGPDWIAGVQDRPGLHEALVQVFVEAGDARAPLAMAVSGDNPTLPASNIDDAVAALLRADAVLGPTADGGYYLVGFRRSVLARRDRARLMHSIFDHHVSGAGARDATHRAMTEAGLSVRTLAACADVDNLSDLRRLASTLAAYPESAPATSAWLLKQAPWLLPATPMRPRPDLQLIASEGGEIDVHGQGA